MNGTRREFIGLGIGGVAAVALGAAFWEDVFGSAASGSQQASAGHGYGPRRPPNEHGIELPAGFDSRVIARGDAIVPGTDYRWHEASDGMATFPVDDGGWILVSNSEVGEGGASAVRFARDGSIADAYRILDGTTQNCSGGGTPWGTWLSCEEIDDGRVWECDPGGRRKAVVHPAMGVFKHEAAAVDPRGRRVYLTEDLVDGGFYRFTPTRWPDLRAGLLEIAIVDAGGHARWTEVPDPAAKTTPTRHQVDGSAVFKRGEGLWHDDGVVYISTTQDSRVWAYDIGARRFDVIYDGIAAGEDAPLRGVDQLTANHAGEVFVCEDLVAGSLDMGLIDRSHRVSRFLSITGEEHSGSELTGVTFDPSGGRMYFSSQRAGGSVGQKGPGAIYEISGPFRGRRGSRRLHESDPSA